jgi:uncharacterized repeat protein (TIGR03803 family)
MFERTRISRIHLRAEIAAAAFAVVFLLGTVPTPRAQAQTLTVLHSFSSSGADGFFPHAGLVMDKEGNLYGTTVFGGSFGVLFGTVFKVDTTGTETVLHSFSGADGQLPDAGLVMDKEGNLYGTTDFGGASFTVNPSGYGTVFKLDTSGKETVLHSFTNAPDGAVPEAGLVMDKEGNLYGTTFDGGASGWGTVFKVDTTGKETVLHSFSFSFADGADPVAVLVRDSNGNLYGTTVVGGTSGVGTVFKVDKTGKETVLYSFTGGTDAAYPDAGLVRDSKGKSKGSLYGTTIYGGTSGYGTVFKLDTSGKETVLHSFTSAPDGAVPEAGLVMDKEGNLYGTTAFGGSSGYGTVFKVDTIGNETVLHTFTGGTDGAAPTAGLVMDKEGNLYGITDFGGSHGCGTVFKLVP